MRPSIIISAVLLMALAASAAPLPGPAPAPAPAPSPRRAASLDRLRLGGAFGIPRPTAAPPLVKVTSEPPARLPKAFLPILADLPSPPSDADENAIYEFYKPGQDWAMEHSGKATNAADALREVGEELIRLLGGRESFLEKRDLSPTPSRNLKRGDQPTVPLSEMPYPTFPPQYPSCYNCQDKYPSISSCAEASAVFQNATNIFNSPMQYVAVIKCACTDTFQAAYPQCLDCFQHTNQCQYLGTDPVGTGAGSVVTNIRSICAFGSALLGGVAAANYPDYNDTTPTAPGTFTDVTQTGNGFIDQSKGSIFGAASHGAGAAPLALLFTSSVALVAGLTLF